MVTFLTKTNYLLQTLVSYLGYGEFNLLQSGTNISANRHNSRNMFQLALTVVVVVVIVVVMLMNRIRRCFLCVCVCVRNGSELTIMKAETI